MPEGCDHKFVDSTRCLKCGWTPPDDLNTILHRIVVDRLATGEYRVIAVAAPRSDAGLAAYVAREFPGLKEPVVVILERG